MSAESHDSDQFYLGQGQKIWMIQYIISVLVTLKLEHSYAVES